MPLDLGVFLPTIGRRGEPLPDPVAAARHAEALGFESVWVVDQLVGGTGTPVLESTSVLAAVAAATERIRLGLGVLVLPLRPVAWVAKHVAALQHLSGDRLVLGVGVGGDRHDASWAAAGVPRAERGRRTDAALAVLPDLVAGKAVRLGDGPGAPTVQLAPGATVPPIAVGGTSGAALARAAAHADEWFPTPMPPDDLRRQVARLAAAAAARGRPAPAATDNLIVAVEGDPALEDAAALRAMLADPDGPYGIPAEHLDGTVVQGAPAAVAERLAASGAAGARRVVATLPAGDWHRQAELLAAARDRAA